MPTYRIDLEYEGTRYHGWQVQKNARSVAGELRRAITGAGASIVELGGAGRTDAGVHALAQTAHLRLRRPVEPAAFRRAVNESLPPDIHVLSVLPAAEGFHARHDALARSYLYQISRRRTAHAKRHVWWVKRALDLPSLSAAAALLEGAHDFALFCERPVEQSSTIVHVASAQIAPAGALVLVRLTASHFLWKMVRRVVGTIMRVGSGELSVEQFAALLSGSLPPGLQEGIARWTAPSSGLFLERVIYPGEGPLAPIAPAIPASEEVGAAGGLYTGPPARSRGVRRAPSVERP